MQGFKQTLTLGTIFFILLPAAHAEEAFDPFFELLVMGGIATLDANDSSAQMTPIQIDKLVQTNDNDWNAGTGQIGIGYVWGLTDDLQLADTFWFTRLNPQLNLYYLGGDIDGDVWRFQNPNYNQAHYESDFNSTRLMFDLALSVFELEAFSVYALGGLGIAWNEINYHAQMNPSCNCEIMDINLDSHHNNGFAYEFGAGITYAVMDDMAISLEYLYTGLNEIQLGNLTDEANGLTIHGNNFDINTQSVLLGLRFAL